MQTNQPLQPPSVRSPRQAVLAVRDEVAKVVVGQDGIITGIIAALLVSGHVLLEGVPGVAKTLLAKSLAAAFDMQFSRVQFTPDLMPADVIGQSIYELVPGQSAGFRFRECQIEYPLKCSRGTETVDAGSWVRQ